MGKINVIAKWNLEKSKWVTPDKMQFGRSFAIGKYEQIINNPTLKYDYIIIANGSRVEDHSKDYTTIKEKEIRMDNVIKYYKNSGSNYKIQVFLMDADAPIIEDARLLAKYIDSLSILPTTSTVNIIGLSKCGAMNLYIPQFF